MKAIISTVVTKM